MQIEYSGLIPLRKYTDKARPTTFLTRLAGKAPLDEKTGLTGTFSTNGAFFYDFMFFLEVREMTEKTKNLRLRLKLYEKGITQTALSRETSIPRQYINGALTGRVNLSPEEEKKIAHVLSCKIQEIF